MDIDIGSLQQRSPDPPRRPAATDGSLNGATMLEVEKPPRKKGLLIRNALGVNGKYIIDMGEYKRKKVKVFVTMGVRRVAVTLPEKWVDAPVKRLKETLNVEGRLAVRDEKSYVVFAKKLIGDDDLIGDVIRENEEIFLLSLDDVEEIDTKIREISKALDECADDGRKARTLSDADVEDITTTTTPDSSSPHVMLLGMNLCYLIPVQLSYTVADVKAFIHLKAPDQFPWPSLDIAQISDFDINVLDDSLSLADLAEQPEEETNNVVIPLFWGKRLLDPSFFLWIPSLHTADSFRGPSSS